MHHLPEEQGINLQLPKDHLQALKTKEETEQAATATATTADTMPVHSLNQSARSARLPTGCWYERMG